VDLPLLAQVANGRRHTRPAAQGKDLRSGSVDDQERPLASTGDVDANLVRAGPDQELRVVGAELRRTKADLAPHGFVRLQLQWNLRVKREFEEGEIGVEPNLLDPQRGGTVVAQEDLLVRGESRGNGLEADLGRGDEELGRNARSREREPHRQAV